MITLLIVIYLGIIGLGLPDSILGTAWPAISAEFAVTLSAASVVSMIINACKAFAGLTNNRIVKKIGSPAMALVSTLLIAAGILCFSFSKSLFVLFLAAIPVGFGSGWLDTVLNNYVAKYYKAMHVNWLHFFWGIGATAGPIIVSTFMNASSWRTGYLVVVGILTLLALMFTVSFPLWKKVKKNLPAASMEDNVYVSNKEAMKTKGVLLTMLSLFCYVGFEVTGGFWLTSYLVEQKALDAVTAAAWTSYFYMGITVGRLVAGFLAIRLSDQTIIRLSCILAICASILFILPLPIECTIVGVIMMAFGAAPLFPTVIHTTTVRFGVHKSQAVIGLQMFSAFAGSTILAPLAGFVSDIISLKFLPVFLMTMIALAWFFDEATNRSVKKNRKQQTI